MSKNDSIDSRLSALEATVNQMDKRLSNVEEGVNRNGEKIDALGESLRGKVDTDTQSVRDDLTAEIRASEKRTRRTIYLLFLGFSLLFTALSYFGGI